MKQKHAFPGTITTYIVGFVGSLLLTMAAYFVVTTDVLRNGAAVAIIIGLAVMQLIVQLVFFLHLGREKQPRWNQVAFVFMAIMVSIIVGGSLWIMNNLNYNMMMSPQEMDQYMIEQNKKGF